MYFMNTCFLFEGLRYDAIINKIITEVFRTMRDVTSLFRPSTDPRPPWTAFSSEVKDSTFEIISFIFALFFDIFVSILSFSAFKLVQGVMKLLKSLNPF